MSFTYASCRAFDLYFESRKNDVKRLLSFNTCALLSNLGHTRPKNNQQYD